MAKLTIKKASTDVTVYCFIQASNVTTGAGLTGLTFETASLVASYVRPLAARQALTLATLAAVDSAHSDGGFKEIDATNMPGIYRLDLPDAVCATGAGSAVVMLKGAANMAPVLLEVQLLTQDPNDVATETTAAAILDDTGTAGVALTAAAIDAILDEVVVGTYTMRQMLTVMGAALAGKLSGGGTTTLTFRGVNDASNVIVATTDSSGNRSVITLTV